MAEQSAPQAVMQPIPEVYANVKTNAKGEYQYECSVSHCLSVEQAEEMLVDLEARLRKRYSPATG